MLITYSGLSRSYGEGCDSRIVEHLSGRGRLQIRGHVGLDHAAPQRVRYEHGAWCEVGAGSPAVVAADGAAHRHDGRRSTAAFVGSFSVVASRSRTAHHTVGRLGRPTQLDCGPDIARARHTLHRRSRGGGGAPAAASTRGRPSARPPTDAGRRAPTAGVARWRRRSPTPPPPPPPPAARSIYSVGAPLTGTCTSTPRSV